MRKAHQGSNESTDEKYLGKKGRKKDKEKMEENNVKGDWFDAHLFFFFSFPFKGSGKFETAERTASRVERVVVFRFRVYSDIRPFPSREGEREREKVREVSEKRNKKCVFVHSSFPFHINR